MGKRLRRSLYVRDRFIVFESDGTEVIAVAFLDGHGDVNRLAWPAFARADVAAFCVQYRESASWAHSR